VHSLLLFSLLNCFSGASPTAESCVDSAGTAMGLLCEKSLHAPQEEWWNAYGQFTYIGSYKPPFAAAYTNVDGSTASLLPSAEYSFTGTLTLFAAVRPWRGAQFILIPELISEQPLSGLQGLGGVIQNFELQKTGSMVPTPYLSRAYLSQNFSLGGEPQTLSSGPMQLGDQVGRRRLVLTLGNFSILDFFDKNIYASNLRRQFFNMAFLTHAAYDFAADARGYTWGLVAEVHHDDWSLRLGHIIAPYHPNQLPLDFRFYKYFGDQFEIEHRHRLQDHPGAVRLLGYRNWENMGRFNDAVAARRAGPTHNAAACSSFNYRSQNRSAPDLCWVRRPTQKMGLGLSLEQELPGAIGLFARGMVSDGQTEVYSYTSTDSSWSAGLISPGALWHRPADSCGLAYHQGHISRSHAAYLEQGGVDGFIGDGRLTQAAEHVVEAFYSVHLLANAFISLDYQHIVHPAYNAARGPLDVYGLRGHADF
jgi:high affinity Mn2+ porin